MRLIDADTLKERFKSVEANGINLLLDRYALKCIDEAPTVDAVEVIRCGECVFQRLGFCRFWGEDITESDFCSYGERGADDEQK